MQPDNPPTENASAKMWLLHAVRFAGIAVVLIGVSGLGDRVDMPRWLSGLLMAGGIGIFFGLPVVLSRRWKGDR